jgi:hypothetical protein
MTEPSEKGPWFGLSDTIVLAVLPVIGYALATAYEYGYLRRYRIPIWIIRPELTYVLIATGALGGLALNMHNMLRGVPRRPWAVLLYLTLLPALMWYLAYEAIRETEWVWGAHLFTPVLFLVVFVALGIALTYSNLIKPIRANRDLDSWWDRWRKKEQTEIQDNTNNMAGEFFSGEIGAKRFYLFRAGFLIYVIVFISKWQGANNSLNQREFLLSSSQPTCVALRRYADNVLCVSVDTLHKRVIDEFRLIPTSDSREMFHIVMLGTLRTSYDSAADTKFWSSRPKRKNSGT